MNQQKVKFLVKLYAIESHIKKPNPYKRGLKRFLRNLFPVYELKPKIVKTIERCDFLELLETRKNIEVDGVKYKKVFHPTKFGRKPLYIQEKDIDELSRGNYYPYMELVK